MLISGFSDADWAGSLDDRRSKGAMQFFLGQILFHGVQESKLLSLDQALKLSISQWQMQQQK